MLLFYSSLTLLPFGLVSNLFSIVIFTRKRFNKGTMGFYYTSISIVNAIEITIGFFIFYTQSLHQDVLLYSDLSCKLFLYSLFLFIEMSTWLNLFVTADRMITIAYPNRFKILTNKPKLLKLFLALFLILAIFNIPNLFFQVDVSSSFNPLTNQTSTIKHCTSSPLVMRARDFVVLTFRYIVPIFLTSIMNTFLIYKVFKIKNRIRALTSVRNSIKRDYNFAVSVIALNIVFLVSLIPSCIGRIVLNMVRYEETSLILTKEVALARLFSSIGMTITTMDFCFDLLVNLAFNKIFKEEFLKFFKEMFFSIKKDSNEKKILSSSQI